MKIWRIKIGNKYFKGFDYNEDITTKGRYGGNTSLGGITDIERDYKGIILTDKPEYSTVLRSGSEIARISELMRYGIINYDNITLEYFEE